MLVQHFNNDSKEALKQLQEGKLLLETDAPYFRIGGRRHHHLLLSYSLTIFDWDDCRYGCQDQRQELREVLEYASRNASQLYQMSAKR